MPIRAARQNADRSEPRAHPLGNELAASEFELRAQAERADALFQVDDGLVLNLLPVWRRTRGCARRSWWTIRRSCTGFEPAAPSVQSHLSKFSDAFVDEGAHGWSTAAGCADKRPVPASARFQTLPGRTGSCSTSGTARSDRTGTCPDPGRSRTRFNCCRSRC